MAVTEINIIAVLLLSVFINAGVCGEPVQCKTENKAVQIVRGKTASSPDHTYEASVAPYERGGYATKQNRCRDRCQEYCERETTPANPSELNWENCTAFSSRASRNRGSSECMCYAWESKPDWEEGIDYISGWCKTAN